MFANFRKKLCASLVGSLMFVSPSCQAGIGAVLFPVGAFELLYGGFKTFSGVTSTLDICGSDKLNTTQKVLCSIGLIGDGLAHLGLGAAATALGVKFNKSNN